VATDSVRGPDHELPVLADELPVLADELPVWADELSVLDNALPVSHGLRRVRRAGAELNSVRNG
jgi:hypothetical protein